MSVDKFMTDEYLSDLNAYWRAANYLAATQLYLLDNPLLREPLTQDQIKKKIVGHWGTVPGACEEVPPMRTSALPCESP